jgi:4-hydroxythreonine-4-phosphate dehydrogenase
MPRASGSVAGRSGGVGPELIAAAWARRVEDGLAPFFAMGGAELIAAAAASRGLSVPIERIASPRRRQRFPHALPVLGDLDGAYTPGEPNREGAALALASLSLAARLTVEGEASAIVTAPIHKARLAEVGFVIPARPNLSPPLLALLPRMR